MDWLVSYARRIATNIYNGIFIGQSEEETRHICTALGAPKMITWPIPYPLEAERKYAYECQVSYRPPDFLVVACANDKVVFKGVYTSDGLLDDANFATTRGLSCFVLDFLLVTIIGVALVSVHKLCESLLYKKRFSKLVSIALVASALMICIVLFAPLSATCHVIVRSLLIF